ncbi:MAG TPA: DNA repair protein RadC [Syntrophomonadaceae bacterium]|nr:DNA repair protein RadC [Syntrophomonadaceae bacterium]
MLPENMRPREKLLRSGEATLSDAELLAILIREGTSGLSALELAQQILAEHGGSLRFLRETSIEELTCHPGIGPAKAALLKAAVEIGRRISIDVKQKLVIKSPDDVKHLLMEDMRFLQQEHFRVLYLDRKGGLIFIEDVSKGGLHSAIVHPREVFKTAIKRSAASVILVHNHPSGDPNPSTEDIQITRRLIEAGNLIGIEVLDHIIIGEHKYCSLKSLGLI